MALDKGSVTIEPLLGAVTSSTGLAGRIFDGLDSRQEYGNLQPSLGLAAARQQLADVAEVIADSVVDEFKANAEVTVLISPGDAALQVSTAPGSPTASNPALPASGLPLGIKGTVS